MHSLDVLRKQSFREWFLLCCGHWDARFRSINSRAAMLEWYSANCELFDTMRTATSVFTLGHRAGSRHPGWWHVVGFPQFGPRLLVDPEQAEGRIERIKEGVLRQRDSFSESGDLLERISYSIPLRNFPDGFEAAPDYLARNGVLDFEETELLNRKNNSIRKTFP